MKKNEILRLLRIGISFVLILYVLGKAGLFSDEGWQNLVAIFAEVELRYLVASIAIGLLVTFVSAFKWYMLLRSRDLPVGLWRICAYYIIGKFFNLVLPTSLGGDVVRMGVLGKDTGKYADSIASVIVERFTGMITLLILGMFAIIASWKTFNLPWLVGGLVAATAVSIIGVWLIVDQRPLRLVRWITGNRSSFIIGILNKIEKFREAVVAYRDDPIAIVIAFINSLLFYFLAIVNVWVSLRVFGTSISLTSMIIAVPVIMVIMNIPISIGGVGLLEFAYSFTLGLFGVTPAVALSTALLMRTKSLMYGLIGGLLYSVMRADPQQSFSDGAFQETIP